MATNFKDRIVETFKLDRESVDRVIAGIEELIHEGNVNRILVRDANGTTVVEFPVTLGVVGVALLPMWAAIGAVAAIAADLTIEVERRKDA